MRFYNEQHPFTCGIDLHARTMHVCILDQAGDAVYDRNLPCRPNAFPRAIAPFRDGLVVGEECMFAWHWVADLCDQENIPFVLGHAWYMKAIHGGKAKNDRIDAGKIARLLRGGNFPLAYVYPKGMRETRGLLRRRTYLVCKRAELLTHLQILNAQYIPGPAAARKQERRSEMASFRSSVHYPAGNRGIAVLLSRTRRTRPYWLFLGHSASWPGCSGPYR